MLAMAAACTFQYGLPYLIPAFRAEGLTLAQAGLLAAAPTAGLLFTLIAWGAAADRWGERRVLAIGLGAAGAILLAGITAGGLRALAACFFLAGAAGAATHASSGRLILGWFAARERGLAMGLRQTAQPLGVALAALVLPSLGRREAFAFLGAFCLVAAVLVIAFVRDPAAPVAPDALPPGTPYRTPVLWRIHAASALLIVPQFTVATFALVFLVDAHGWDPAAAGRLLAAGQIIGALGRLAVGWWSDRTGSRMRPMRQVALGTAVVLAVLAAGAGTGLAIPALLLAGVLAVSPNGLAFTAVAEYAGRSWAGRALGIQNTAQNIVATATPPAMAALIATTGYGPGFAAAIAFPLVAAAVMPTRTESAPERAPSARANSPGRR
ncbi:MFS transporter [Paractinoplanes tereljensis]|uniref:MFS transporter n=2 Tax=Paractinoplanes tereljensis TaxID=571912 RepID=A0A919NK63_9ACTN|nr:MFS transporter [Actinoplanes tereljensis]